MKQNVKPSQKKPKLNVKHDETQGNITKWREILDPTNGKLEPKRIDRLNLKKTKESMKPNAIGGNSTQRRMKPKKTLREIGRAHV